jgi:hypothetical protein
VRYGVSNSGNRHLATKDAYMHQLVPIVGIVCAVGLPLSIPIIYVALSYLKRRRLMELCHAERMAAIERGMEIPPLPIEVLGTPRKNRSALLPGLIWLFVGLALLLAGWREQEGVLGAFGGAWLCGLVSTGVGIAYLIYYFAEGRKQFKESQLPKERP